MDTSSSAPEAGAGRGQEASSSSQDSGVTRGAWKGSDVKQPEIDWLYRSRRIPAQVSCRLPGNEREPIPEPGEVVVFIAHFERGFGLPASNFFRQFLDFYELQPHHLPGNANFLPFLLCFFHGGLHWSPPYKRNFRSLLLSSDQLGPGQKHS
jgi:hypothetical protein